MRPRYGQGPDLSLAGLPFPRRDLLPRGAYFTPQRLRGDPRLRPRLRVLRRADGLGAASQYQKPVEDVVADIRQQGAQKLLFVDLNLISDPRYARAALRGAGPAGDAVVRPRDHAHRATTRELSALAARSGCRGLLMGLESICEASLDQTQQGFNAPEEYREVVADLHGHGIALQGCFVFGLDGDTPDVFEQTARFAVEARIDLPRFAIVTPFPGTPLYKRLEAEGRILTRTGRSTTRSTSSSARSG